MESSGVPAVFMLVFGILVVALVTLITVVSVVGNGTVRKIAIVTVLSGGLFLFMATLFLLGAKVTRVSHGPGSATHVTTKVGHSAPIHSEMVQVATTSTSRPLSTNKLPEVEANMHPGFVVGEFAGSMYQGFRDQLSSGEIADFSSRIIPPGRPEWVESDERWDDQGNYFIAVSSGPYDREIDCRKALDRQIQETVDEFVNELFDNPNAYSILSSELADAREGLVEDQYREQLTNSFGEMHQWHAHLKILKDVQQGLQKDWKTKQKFSRMLYAAGGFAVVLSLLGITYAGLLVDRRSGWLASAAMVIAIALVISVSVALVRTFPMV